MDAVVGADHHDPSDVRCSEQRREGDSKRQCRGRSGAKLSVAKEWKGHQGSNTVGLRDQERQQKGRGHLQSSDFKHCREGYQRGCKDNGNSRQASLTLESAIAWIRSRLIRETRA